MTPEQLKEWKRITASCRERATGLGLIAEFEAEMKLQRLAGALPPDAAERALQRLTTPKLVQEND